MEGYASHEIVLFLKKHTSSCPVCGLMLGGCKTAVCPGCAWKLDLEVLRSREPTVANIVSKWDAYCPACGYNLKGTTGEGCPECGSPLNARSLVLPGDGTVRIRRPKTVAMLVGVAVCAFVFSAATAIIQSRGVSGFDALPCLAGPVLGALAAWGVLTAERVGHRR
jgi:putative hemolysin